VRERRPALALNGQGVTGGHYGIQKGGDLIGGTTGEIDEGRGRGSSVCLKGQLEDRVR
jgi:hypothetical protein